MEILLDPIWILFTLSAAVYAQYRIPFHTANAYQARLTRALLGIIGVAMGWAAIRYQQAAGLRALLAFLNGFGAVHVPAAAILFLKRQRRKSVQDEGA
jgi:hypothetical protein